MRDRYCRGIKTSCYILHSLTYFVIMYRFWQGKVFQVVRIGRSSLSFNLQLPKNLTEICNPHNNAGLKDFPRHTYYSKRSKTSNIF